MALVQGGAIAQTGSVTEKLIPWIDQPAQVPPTAKGIRALTRGEDLDSWITPNDKFFCIAHYDVPTIDDKAWRLEVAGLVAKPLTYTLNEVTSTLECAGNRCGEAI
jgi:DMSO/TMAO reductase YedYZ molybdopterin-dependent catalytic subunit